MSVHDNKMYEKFVYYLPHVAELYQNHLSLLHCSSLQNGHGSQPIENKSLSYPWWVVMSPIRSPEGVYLSLSAVQQFRRTTCKVDYTFCSIGLVYTLQLLQQRKQLILDKLNFIAQLNLFGNCQYPVRTNIKVAVAVSFTFLPLIPSALQTSA